MAKSITNVILKGLFNKLVQNAYFDTLCRIKYQPPPKKIKSFICDCRQCFEWEDGKCILDEIMIIEDGKCSEFGSSIVDKKEDMLKLDMF